MKTSNASLIAGNLAIFEMFTRALIKTSFGEQTSSARVV